MSHARDIKIAAFAALAGGLLATAGYDFVSGRPVACVISLALCATQVATVVYWVRGPR